MKKILTLLLLSVFLFSCGPKRMKCYGKRCVENTAKKTTLASSKVNS